MRFGFDEDQLLLQKTLRDFLASEVPVARVRALWDTETGRSAELWKALADLGVTGLLVPEAHGGMGMDERFLVLLHEEAGRAALAEPLVATSVAVPLWVGLGARELGERWLARIALGEAIVAVGHPVNAFISDAHLAGLLLLPHADELHALVPEDVALVRLPVNDPARRVFSVDWSPATSTRIARGEKARDLLAAALDRGALACAAQLLGVTERLLEQAVAYAQQRKQFGRAIGSFQAVKHMCAEMIAALEPTRSLLWYAAHSFDALPDEAPQMACHVLAHVSEIGREIASTATQVHGGIGWTDEQNLHFWFKRIAVARHLLGGPELLRERAAELQGLVRT